MRKGAWYVRADEMIGELNARRLAAVLTPGAADPGRRLAQKGARYQVVAGPYRDKSGCGRRPRSKSDLEIEGVIIGPAGARELALDASRGNY